MINTLNIGKYIYSTISGDDQITCKVYPLVADNDAKFPFIVYRRSGLVSGTTKDGLTEDDVTVEIVIVSDKYSVGLDLAIKVRNLLEKQSVIYEDIEINDTTLNLATEEYSDNSYIQRMQFDMKINKY
jgi:hypothetical protein